jgi:uncharacterized membrane protein
MKTEAQITERNIKAIHKHEKAELAKAPRSLKIAHRITFFAGTVTFVVSNAVIFITWILMNSLSPWKFDPYPFTLLTMAVSLEAIFLSTFILISQNALATHSERRHKLNLHISLLAEEEDTAMLKLLDKMAEKMGIPEEDRIEVKLMSVDVHPEEVLRQIAKIENED